jgi:prolyl oligopeptidase
VVPEDRDAVIAHNFGGADTILPTASRLYVVDLVGGPNQIRAFTPTGERVGSVPVPAVAGVSELTRMEQDAVLYRTSTFTEPPAWYRFAGPSAAHAGSDPLPNKLPLSSTSAADFSDTEVLRDTAVSKDGTRVPLNIIRRKGTALNGKDATLVTGYGGYGISLSPFLGAGRVWLDQGGVFVVANLRGRGDTGGSDAADG